MSTFEIQTEGSSTPVNGKIPTDKHLIKEYRVRFEGFFDSRYQRRRQTHANIMPYLVPFARALGFSFTVKGPRYVPWSDDQFTLLDNLCYRVVQWNSPKLFVYESRAASACVAAAILFSLGCEETDRYLAIEQEAVLFFKADLGRIRLRAKRVFSALMSRFDQYLTCSPISPIVWSAPKIRVLKHGAPSNDVLEWLDEIIESRKASSSVRRKRTKHTVTAL